MPKRAKILAKVLGGIVGQRLRNRRKAQWITLAEMEKLEAFLVVPPNRAEPR